MRNYQANIITKSPVTPTGPSATGSAPGIWRLDEVAYWVKQGLWPNANIIPDTYFAYVSLLLSTTSLSNANNNLLVDSSGSFLPVSRNGNATQGSLTPYGSNWSNYFDGSSDWVQFPGASQFAIATSTTPFTVEAWIYPTAIGGCVFSEEYTGSGNSIPINVIMSNGTEESNGRFITFAYYTGFAWVLAAVSNTEVFLNTWTHVACVFTGSTTKIYFNGVDVTKTSSPTPATTWGVTGVNGSNWFVGRRWDTAGTPWFSGYISNLRFVNGTAVYTSNFTPPTTPLTAITNTVLLTCQSNRFRDASSNNFTATPNGNVLVTDYSPFPPTPPGISYNQSDITNWSGYFDGSGDSLTVPSNAALAFGTGDFTIEFWTYRISGASSDNFIISSASNGGFFFGTKSNGWGYGSTGNFWSYNTGVIPALNTWQHVAISRSGTSIRIFVDGSQIGTTQTDSSDWSLATGGTTIGSQGASYYYNGYLSNIRVLKGTALYTTNFTPPTSPLTAISGTSLLTCQNAAFTDNSANNFVITQNGNVTVTGNSPFNTTGYWSNYFDGSGDYFTVPYTTANFDWYTAGVDFTIEYWFFTNNLTGTSYSDAGINHSTIVGNRSATALTDYWSFGPTSAGTVTFYYFNGGPVAVTSTSTITTNTWNHVAMTKTSSGITIFVNGVAQATTAISGTPQSSASVPITVGQGNNTSFDGYVSNLRIVRGTAIYSGNFTPPTAPLSAVTNTTLLTCQNGRFIDNSTNNLTLTITGNTSIQSLDPFYASTIASNGGSMYFDGSGDFLALQNNPSYTLGSGDFRLEVWVYPLAQGGHGSSNNDCIIDFRPGSNGAYGTLYSLNNGTSINWYANTGVRITGAAIPNNSWSHLCVSRVSGNTRLFINGVQSGSTYVDSTNYLQTNPWIGQFNDGVGGGWFQGYMSGMRIVKGSGVSSTFTPPTSPPAPTPSTTLMLNGMNAGIYDATAINDMETVGNAQVTTAVSKFGGSSVYFDGNGDLLVGANNPTLNLGSGDFTIELWVNVPSVSSQQGLVTKRLSDQIATGTWGLRINSGGNLYFEDITTPTGIITFGTLATNTWTHVAVTRSGTTVRGFLNGTLISSGTSSRDFTNSYPLFVGIWGTSGGSWPSGTIDSPLNGYIDDLRITRGIARYTANFTPPTQAFPAY